MTRNTTLLFNFALTKENFSLLNVYGIDNYYKQCHTLHLDWTEIKHWKKRVSATSLRELGLGGGCIFINFYIILE